METTETYSLRDILRVIFSHKIYFVVLPVILTVSAYIGSQLKTPVYTAGVKMFVKAEKKTEAEFYIGISGRNILSDHSELVTSNSVLNRVVEALKLYDRPVDYERKYALPLKKAFIDYRLRDVEEQPDKRTRFAMAMGNLASSISVVPIGESKLFYINVTDLDPVQAVQIANSVSRSYVIFDLEQQIEEIKLKYGEKHSTLLQLNGYIEDFKKTLHGQLIPDIEAIGPASVKIVAQAEGASMQAGVSKNTLMIFSFFTGIFLAIALAVMSEYFSTTINSSLTITKQLNMPFLGSLPERKSNEELLITKTNPNMTKYTRSLQILSEQLSLLMGDKKIAALLLTDVEGSAETSIVSANLAIYAAHHTGRKVLMIDADLRKASLSKMFNVQNNMGLAGILEGKSSLMNAIYDMGSNLYILPSGETELNPVMLLDSTAMSKVIYNAKEIYDFIFIHCPDLKNYTDACLISYITDGTILVLNEGKVKRQIFSNTIAPLRQKDVKILGTVLTNCKYVIPEIIYKVT